MRTTVEIDDEVLQAAREISRIRKATLGQTLSDLAKQGLERRSAWELRDEEGVPVIVRRAGFTPVTSEIVYRLQDDED